MLIHDSKHLAIYLKSIREDLGLNQTVVGESMGLKQATVSQFENKPGGSRLDTFFRMLAALNLEMHLQSRSDPVAGGGWTEEW